MRRVTLVLDDADATLLGPIDREQTRQPRGMRRCGAQTIWHDLRGDRAFCAEHAARYAPLRIWRWVPVSAAHPQTCCFVERARQEAPSSR